MVCVWYPWCLGTTAGDGKAVVQSRLLKTILPAQGRSKTFLEEYNQGALKIRGLHFLSQDRAKNSEQRINVP